MPERINCTLQNSVHSSVEKGLGLVHSIKNGLQAARNRMEAIDRKGVPVSSFTKVVLTTGVVTVGILTYQYASEKINSALGAGTVPNITDVKTGISHLLGLSGGLKIACGGNTHNQDLGEEFTPYEAVPPQIIFLTGDEVSDTDDHGPTSVELP